MTRTVYILTAGEEENLAQWSDGPVPRRGERVDIDHGGSWKVVEVSYRVIGSSLKEPIGVPTFVYVEKWSG